MVVQPDQTDFESLVSRMNLDQRGGSSDLLSDLLGEQQRDFVYVDDVVEANMKALEQVGSEVYNIGTGVGTTVNAIFTRLANLIGYTGLPKYEPPRNGEVFKIYLNNQKAERELRWTPSVDLGSGLGRTVEALRSMA